MSLLPSIFDFILFTAGIVYAGTKHSLYSDRIADYKKVIIGHALHFILVIDAAFLLYFDHHIASTSLDNSFLGISLIAAVTSLPELLVSLATSRIALLDMAVADLFYSNLFNIFTLGTDGVFYREVALLNNISSFNLITVFITIIMTLAVSSRTFFKQKNK